MSENTVNDHFALNRNNYVLMAIGVALVIIGFFLMSGGGAADTATYSPEVFSDQRMFVAPITILAGYGLVMFGIIKK